MIKTKEHRAKGSGSIKIRTFIMIVLLAGGGSGVFGERMVKGADHSDIKQTTHIRITIPEDPVSIDPMIYGQMLEDCSDRVIYDGVVDQDGAIRPKVDALVKSLDIPIVRWPGGTFVREYHWENGIGPLEKRPVVPVVRWGGTENHRFGTDEFLAWCRRVGTTPYINFNTNLHKEGGGTLEDALRWIEYVNGDSNTVYGKKRMENGHIQPYNVRYWGIGNEDYLKTGLGVPLTAGQYADLLDRWSSAIRKRWPDLQLIGVGHYLDWNETVLEKCADNIDWITQHYYVVTKLIDGKIEQPEMQTFAPLWIESHLRQVARQIEKHNQRVGRNGNPIRISVDEWNNRHILTEKGKKKFTRHDPRRLFDVAVTAGVLNVFIRQSPSLGMGNYIFPVNGHGAIRTVGDDGYGSAIYDIFRLYRNKMTGKRMDVSVQGPGISWSSFQCNVDGDTRDQLKNSDFKNWPLTFIDCVALKSDEDHMNIVMINRSADQAQLVNLDLPIGYHPVNSWTITHSDINAANTDEDREKIVAKERIVLNHRKTYRIEPCSFLLLETLKNHQELKGSNK